ncbi:ANTAR domain-containing response regulator [Tolumonas lignilytica]|jgi:Response regulator with putative antiterminator output domain|uniref:ANTAR domain-containing response regulator n=1 Tax=Tolumonas lignilytica TaxID=1283284 RepID=UPI0004631E3D|nr:ANTAR domain-containing protein [Tolumonas lignilytica]
MSYSKILIYSDDIAQANRLGLLLSRYGHEPFLVKQIDPMHPPGGINGAMLDCRRLPAEWRLIATTLASQGLPVVLFMENLPENQQQLLLEAGVTLVPHRVEEKEPVESWLKQARLQQDVMRKQQLAVDDLTLRLEENKLIQQAKARLMKVQGLDEETAYKVMRSTAMKNNQSMADLARRILATLVD